MLKIINKTSTPVYDYVTLLVLIFSQFFIILFFMFNLISFFYLVQPTLSDKIFLLGVLTIFIMLSYFIVKAIIIALKYFFALEECFCENGKFYYKKVLFNKIRLKAFSLNVYEIASVVDLGKRIIEPEKDTAINYFKPNERIGIKLVSGIEYKIWNYVRKRTLFSIDNSLDKDLDFLISLERISEMIRKEQFKLKNKLNKKYEDLQDDKYSYILNKILNEEKLFLLKKDETFIINGDSEAIENLEIFKNMNFKEINFYVFYVNYLSKKEYENKKILVGYNGVDGKEVTISKLKEDINEIRDSRSSFK